MWKIMIPRTDGLRRWDDAKQPCSKAHLAKVAADVSHSAAAAEQRVEHDVRVLTGTKRMLPSQNNTRGTTSHQGVGTYREGSGRLEPDQKSIPYNQGSRRKRGSLGDGCSCRAVPTKCTPPTFEANACADIAAKPIRVSLAEQHCTQDTAESGPTLHSSRPSRPPIRPVSLLFPRLSLCTAAAVHCMITLKHVPRITM